MQAVKAEFKKHRTSTRAEIKPTKVREFLKKLKLNKYYEHTNAICNILNGVPPPKLSTELEERLKAMFMEIQEPFERNCPPNRKNFLSYGFTLYKFVELLGEVRFLHLLPKHFQRTLAPWPQDSLKASFPLLKSTEKLYAQDQIWKKICRDLQWEFIPSL